MQAHTKYMYRYDLMTAENVGTEGTYRSISDNEDLVKEQNGQYEPIHLPEHAETPKDTPRRPGKVIEQCMYHYNTSYQTA